MDKVRVKAETALTVSLGATNACQKSVPLHGVSCSASNIRRLVIAIVLRIDVIAIASPADTGVVRARAIAAVDRHSAESLAQRLEELIAQILKAVIIPLLDLGSVVAVEFLYREVLRESMSRCHKLVSPAFLSIGKAGRRLASP